jgi:hypothetical protein
MSLGLCYMAELHNRNKRIVLLCSPAMAAMQVPEQQWYY